MKVNSLSAEGKINQSWSTTCRVPHMSMFLWDGMMQTIAMNHLDPWLSLEYCELQYKYQLFPIFPTENAERMENFP